MITCERCQTENIEGSQYCDECGGDLPGMSAGGKRPAPEDGDTAAAAAAAEPPAAAPPPAADSAERRRTTSDSHPVVLDSRPSVVESRPAARAGVVSPAARSAFAGRARVREHDEAPPLKGASSASPHAKLVIHRGRSVGKEFPMCEDESHIGRWDADGGIFPDVDLDSDDPEAKVSRRHARITRRSGQYYIEDLGSTNGTFVNRGRRLLPGDRQPLRDGDEVIVGKTFLKFHLVNK
jgi:hypothetical protein